MHLVSLDWIIIGVFFVIVIGIGWVASRTARANTSEYFLGGRGMPWWLLGISMVACTFSADTPNLVTDFVRQSGVAKNWAWWAFLITGMVTVFIYAKLWRRSDVLTDLEFYELRYSGKMASFLRVFRSLYLGLFFNILIMASVSLAAIKIGSVMFGLPPWLTIVAGSAAVVLYAGIGGLKGVIWADFFQYSIALFGAIYAAYVALIQPEVGGLDGLLSHPDIQDKLSFIPDFSDPGTLLTLLIIPIAVQWWSVWYPGAEPGGGGYIAQRMLSAKDEKNAIGATFLFNFMHYAIRPWPWIIVALASLIIYPDLASIQAEFGHIPEMYLKDDIAYPVMMSKLGPGWLGLVVASLIAAYMSTIGTHLNWGASYIVNDFYKRIVKPKASEKELVHVGQLSTVLLMLLSGIIALTVMENAMEAFNILLLAGAGSGAIYLLRWFWWRINALTEIVAMVSATLTAIILIFGIDDATLSTTLLDAFTVRLLLAVGITTTVWLLTTFLSKPEDEKTLIEFYKRTRPGGPGWKRIAAKALPEETNPTAWAMPVQLLNVFIGCVSIYAALFGIGSLIYKNWITGSILLGVTFLGTFIMFKLFHRLRADL
ncbi:MAG: Na+:solute symporter [Salinivirgaceae bacterium]|jgi:SSS family solute:Na+ symporter|nr:Na+:solute symporter [Salinivirgaceae bacterium]